MNPMDKSPISRRQALRITAVGAASIAFASWLRGGLVAAAPLHRARATRVQLGTLVTISVVHDDAVSAKAMLESTFAEIERLENIFSRYRPETPVSRLNRAGQLANPPPELVEVLHSAQRYAMLTNGAFDVTVGPVLELYSSRSRAGSPPPDLHEVEATLALIDWRRLSVGDDLVSLGLQGMKITLDGIAKGYVVDRAIQSLLRGGAERVLVDAGGDMASSPQPRSEEPWRVALQDPRNPGASLGVVDLRGDCIATSGDYLETFTPDRRLNHIIDPRTGRSPENTSSVSIIAPTAMDADALATAVFVLGPQAGVDLVSRLDGVEALVVAKHGEQTATAGMRARLDSA
jgi:FAD:protein FMN transferase